MQVLKDFQKRQMSAQFRGLIQSRLQSFARRMDRYCCYWIAPSKLDYSSREAIVADTYFIAASLLFLCGKNHQLTLRGTQLSFDWSPLVRPLESCLPISALQISCCPACSTSSCRKNSVQMVALPAFKFIKVRFLWRSGWCCRYCSSNHQCHSSRRLGYINRSYSNFDCAFIKACFRANLNLGMKTVDGCQADFQSYCFLVGMARSVQLSWRLQPSRRSSLRWLLLKSFSWSQIGGSHHWTAMTSLSGDTCLNLDLPHLGSLQVTAVEEDS